ncbi:MAG TPA: DUF3996 domain-containing protein [Kofleriaceae bacterium]|nr:DUF3996 domain-containing protein [Kofleriaceae bacterium]
MKLRTALLPLLLVVLTAVDADARRNRRMGGSRYVSNGTFGLGLELGGPTGLNGKYFLSESGALNFGIGADGYYRDRDGLHLYLDYLWHPISLANPPEFQLPFYIGIGGRLWDFNDGPDDSAVAFGLRIPLGIAFDFNNVPLDIFIQLTPTLDFYRDYRDDAGFWFDFSLGIRYWFN